MSGLGGRTVTGELWLMVLVCLTQISFDDYAAAVSADPLLLEAFGQCLPTRYSVISFLSTLT